VSARRSQHPTKAEREQRIAEVAELLLTRVGKQAIVRFAAQRWGVSERSVERYMAEARERIRKLAEVDLTEELGKARGTYELIFAKQMAGGDLRGARLTLKDLVGLAGLSGSERRIQKADAEQMVDLSLLSDEELEQLRRIREKLDAHTEEHRRRA
jgi:hypothetical protein